MIKSRRSGSFRVLLFIFFFFLISNILIGCSQNDSKFQQYFVRGEKNYEKHCQNCHQKSGKGLGRVYPPLNNSDFVDQHFDEVICTMKFGKEGEVIVNGISYNKPMKAMPNLTELEIAEIATYLYNNWDRKVGLVEISAISTALKNCDIKN